MASITLNINKVKNDVNTADTMTIIHGTEQTKAGSCHQEFEMSHEGGNSVYGLSSLLPDCPSSSASSTFTHQGLAEEETVSKQEAVPEIERELPPPTQASQEVSQQQSVQLQDGDDPAPVAAEVSNAVVSLNRNGRDEDRTLNNEEQGAAACSDPVLMENLKSEPAKANTPLSSAEGDDFVDALSNLDLADQLGSGSVADRSESQNARGLGQATGSSNGPDSQAQALESTLAPVVQTDIDCQRRISDEDEPTHQSGGLNVNHENGDFDSLAAVIGSIPFDSVQSDTELKSTHASVIARKAEHSFSASSEHGFSSLSTTSLGTDGGIQTNEDRIIVHHRGLLLGRDHLNISFVDFCTEKDVLRKAEQDGYFAEHTLLLKAKWLGHRSFTLTRWKICFRSPVTDNHNHLCCVLQDTEAVILSSILNMLKCKHKVFLQEIQWDDGLVITLGHANPQRRQECLQSPVREQIQRTLQLLLPASSQNAVLWQEPIEADEEEFGAACSCRETNTNELLAQRLADCTQMIKSHNESVKEEKEFLRQTLQTFQLFIESSKEEKESTRQEYQNVHRQLQRLQQREQRPEEEKEDKVFFRQTMQKFQSFMECSKEEKESMGQGLQNVFLQLQRLQQRELASHQRTLSPEEEQLRREQAKQIAELKQSQELLTKELKALKLQQEQKAETEKSYQKFMMDFKRQMEQDLVKIRKETEFKVHKIQEENAHKIQEEIAHKIQEEIAHKIQEEIAHKIQQEIAHHNKEFQSKVHKIQEEFAVVAQRNKEMVSKVHKIQEEIAVLTHLSQEMDSGKNASLKLFDEEIKKWGSKFRLEGNRALQAALQQMQEISLQRRELEAQRDQHLEQTLQNFNVKLLARVAEREKRIQTMTENFYTYLCQREMDMKAEQQAILMDMYKIKKEYAGLDKGEPSVKAAAVSLEADPSIVMLSPQSLSPLPLPQPDNAGEPASCEHSYTVGVSLQEEGYGPSMMFKGGNPFSSANAESAYITSRHLGKSPICELYDKEHRSSEMTYYDVSKFEPRVPESLPLAEEDKSPSPESEASMIKTPDSESLSGSKKSPAAENKDPKMSENSTSSSRTAACGERSTLTAQEMPREIKPEIPATSPGRGKDGSTATAKEEILTSETPSLSEKSKADAEEDLSRARQFLDWINVHGSAELQKSLSSSVNEALKPEVIPAPRAKCLDTILCLDVSDSIVKEGHLQIVKNTALDFVDGIEDLMAEVELEENIAVVVMGGTARVVQHLTNDLTLVRAAIESLDESCTGGRSPFMQALLVCLAANKGRGGVVNVSGYKIRPRIIFISDGCPTDEAQDFGPDLQSNVNQVKFTLVQVLSQLAAKKHKNTPRPLHCVPVGKRPDQQFLQSMAELGGGKLVSPKEIRSLCLYYKKQQTIGRLYKMVKNHDCDDQKIKEVLKAIAPEAILLQEEEEIVAEVKNILKNPPVEDEPDADDFNNVVEIEEKVKRGELLALGTRVVRGPDWKWDNQDRSGPGTVILHSKKDNWIYVKWDNGNFNAYRYNEDGKSDIVETLTHPRRLHPDSPVLDFGVRVVRGPDWKSENVDDRGPGTVIRVRDSDGKIKVRWDKTGKICEHHFSVTNGKEVKMLEIVEITSPETAPAIPDPDAGKYPVWLWLDSKQQWRMYNEASQEKLEEEYKKRPKVSSCVVAQNGVQRRVIFSLMHEKTEDGATYVVKRDLVDDETRNYLLATELSMYS